MIILSPPERLLIVDSVSGSSCVGTNLTRPEARGARVAYEEDGEGEHGEQW